MSTTIIYPQGSVTETVPDGDKIAIASFSSLTLLQQVGFPNYPDQWEVIYTTAPGESYTSAAFTGDTIVMVQASAAVGYYDIGASPTISPAPSPDLTAAATPWVLAGLSAAQGGSATLKGGTSSTSGNAGGAAALLGGQAGATGAGGAATVTGAAGGASSGAGGAASLTGGAGTASNAVGGAAAATGGAGHGSSAGGAASSTGGVGGATGAGGAASVLGGAGGATSGSGGTASVTGGAGTNGNANGGPVILTGGAGNGSGIAGSIIERSAKGVHQGTPTAKTTSATLTGAEVKAGIITVNQGAGGASALQLPTGTALLALFPNFAADDAFDFSVINISTTAAESCTITTNTDWTLVGDIDIAANSGATTKSAGRFRARYTGTTTWTLYRLS